MTRPRPTLTASRRRLLSGVVFAAASLGVGPCAHALEGRAEPALTLNNAQVPGAVRFLEEKPLDERAQIVRALLLQWEDKSPEVQDVVCPGIFAPVTSETTPHSGSLIFQTIFGSAAHQLANPADKGKLMPSQLAGMTSMLKAYRSLIALEPTARIPRFDEFARLEAEGKLPGALAALVAANCDPAPATPGTQGR